jgi:very-short-patch-repair endonuclease
MQRIPPELRSAARALRRDTTPAERKLWHALWNHRPRFTRQLIVSHYIIDVACRTLKLAIELDGAIMGSRSKRTRSARPTCKRRAGPCCASGTTMY